MNKRILTVAVAALALAACSKNETVEVAGNRAIEFGAFVNKATRAAINQTTDMTHFYVFGGYEDVQNQFNNTEVGSNGETGVLWTANAYKFAAYSDGNEKSTVVTHNWENNRLVFTNYATTGVNDLVAATATADNTQNAVEGNPVELNFKHLLSKIKFTFSTDAADSYTMKVYDIKITAATSGTATYDASSSNTTWTVGEQNGNYAVKELADIAIGDPNTAQSTEECFVIPQNNQTLKVSFKVDVTDGGAYKKEGVEFTGDLTVSTDAQTANTWISGYAYNYTAQIDLEDVDGTVKYIKFTPEVTPWVDNAVDGTPITPATQVQP